MKIAILGLGTIGSFLSIYLSELKKVNNLILVDNDIVENKNLKNTPYKNEHVNKLKVNCVKELINKDNVTIKTVPKMFIEDETIIGEFDYIIDCRDYKYSRKNIDIRLYFSGRNLIIDCRKDITYENEVEGKYLTNLSKLDVINSVSAVASMFNSDIIFQLMKENMIYRYEIDHCSLNACEHIEKRKDLPTIIDNQYENVDNLLNIRENVNDILTINNKNDMMLYIGPKEFPTTELVIGRNTLNSYNDVVKLLRNSIIPHKCSYYIVSVGELLGNNYIELIPDTGAA